MKRILLEILLVLGLAGAGYMAWSQKNLAEGAAQQIKEATEQAEAAQEKIKTAEEGLSKEQERVKALQPKAQQLDAVKGALAGGQVLSDLEKLYAREKNLSSERMLGLGMVRLMTKGPEDAQSLETLQKTLQLVDWNNQRNIICATQNALAAAGQDVKVLAECNTPKPIRPEPESKAGDKKDDHKSAHAGPAWSYEGDSGPEHWGKEFPSCAKGKTQAPLNITGPMAKTRYLLAPDYKLGELTLLNNGHTLQVSGTAGSKLRVDSKPYDLVQFHFHRPSEEQFDGKAFPMNIHFVHKNDAGEIVVIGVMVKEGNENPGIRTLWTHAPAKEGPAVSPEGVKFNPGNLLPRERDYYTYQGSLTTPPCTEPIRFFILKTPINMSREQIAQFPFKHNARPVQPLNGRVIESN
ncbi:MAG: carbonic anhydrase family protein [Limnohabitans sp.]